MAKAIILALLGVGLLVALGWYLLLGITTPPGEYTDPWLDNMVIPIVAVSVFFMSLPMVIVASALRGTNSRAMRNAPIGIGTVTGTKRTGLAVNGQPQLLISLTVRTADGGCFESVAKQFVDLTELSSVAPGVVLPVRYRPGRTEMVQIDRSGDTAAIQAVYHQVQIRAGLTSQRSIDIATRGVTAQAVVAATRPTGRIVQGNPEMSLSLMVSRPDGSSYETTVTKVVAANLVGHLQVGRVVTCHYLPGAEHEVALQLAANPHA